jgi:hypothetical protein
VPRAGEALIALAQEPRREVGVARNGVSRGRVHQAG